MGSRRVTVVAGRRVWPFLAVVPFFFGAGFGIGLVIGLDEPWEIGVWASFPPLAWLCSALLARHIARTPYDGNDRSRILPRRKE